MDKEVVVTFAKWSKRAVIGCLKQNNIVDIDPSDEVLNQSLDRCFMAIVQELLSCAEEWQLHQRALVK